MTKVLTALRQAQRLVLAVETLEESSAFTATDAPAAGTFMRPRLVEMLFSIEALPHDPPATQALSAQAPRSLWRQIFGFEQL